MGLNFRKIFNLGKFFRISISKSGIEFSIGSRGFRIGFGPRGKRLTMGIPGTGIYYRKNSGWGNRRIEPQPAPRQNPSTESMAEEPMPEIRNLPKEAENKPKDSNGKSWIEL